MVGYFSRFTNDPGIIGDCDGEITFTDVASLRAKKRVSAKLHRASFFSEWQVVSLDELPTDQ